MPTLAERPGAWSSRRRMPTACARSCSTAPPGRLLPLNATVSSGRPAGCVCHGPVLRAEHGLAWPT
eukprot:6598515-Lingulodinium_polyedra.AAC.1